jgi:hypothetical protein
MAAKISRRDERQRPNGPWSALRCALGKRCAFGKHNAFGKRGAFEEGRALWLPSFPGQSGSAQIFTGGMSYAVGIGQASG